MLHWNLPSAGSAELTAESTPWNWLAKKKRIIADARYMPLT